MAPLLSLGLPLLRLSAPRLATSRPSIAAHAWQQSRSHRLSPTGDELYEKTTVTRIERDSAEMMLIESYSSIGFIINGDQVVGPCAVLPRSILQWNVASYKDVSLETLSLFHLLVPKIVVQMYNCFPIVPGSKVRENMDSLKTVQKTTNPELQRLIHFSSDHFIIQKLPVNLAEILVLGTGDRVQRLDPAISRFMRQKGVALEVQDTANACATFNFLTSERRVTAAALIPVSA